jgi:hypothetical protein
MPHKDIKSRKKLGKKSLKNPFLQYVQFFSENLHVFQKKAVPLHPLTQKV